MSEPKRNNIAYNPDLPEYWFIRVPKTGSRSVREALYGSGCCNNRTGINFNDTEGKIPWTQKLDHPVGHISVSEAKEYTGEEGWSRLLSFAFVRNPWAKMVSGWAYKIWSKGQNIPFHRWLMDDDYDPLFKKPMVDYIENDVTFVGKYENLHSDFEHICYLLGIPPIELESWNKSSHTDYHDYYDERTKKYVADKYKKDIKTYGYKY
jgi:hypothetical protein